MTRAGGLSSAKGRVRRGAARRDAHCRRTDVQGVRQERQEQELNTEVSSSQPVLDAHPWVALSLFTAFTKAKQQCYGTMDSLLRSSVMPAFGVLETQRRTFGDDPFPYGVRENREALQTVPITNSNRVS